MKEMDNAQLAEISKDQLNRVLGFFPRVDTVSSVVVGVDVGMLAILASNAPAIESFTWYMLFALIPLWMLLMSLWHLYQGSFPRLEGGWNSLIYFREIAQREEEAFITELTSLSEEKYVKELLSQVWRNSQILTQKFNRLRAAFVWLAIAVIPWIIALFMFTSHNTESFLKK